MGKNPAEQFYWEDWKRDTRCLSLAAKGAWIDLLSDMWFAPTRGKLSMPLVAYARSIGATVDQTAAVIKELIDLDICDSVTERNENITLINRRMFRESEARKQGAYRQDKFRQRQSNAEVTLPSSKPSKDFKHAKPSTSKQHTPKPPLGGLMARFERFYQAYPKKSARGDAEKAWRQLKPNEELLIQMLAAVERQKTSWNWVKDNGQYIPAPGPWLRAKRWLDEVKNGSAPGDPSSERTAKETAGGRRAGPADWEAEERRAEERNRIIAARRGGDGKETDPKAD